MGMTSEEAKGYKPLGEELRRLRKSKKMTRKELAAVVGNGCSEKTISQYENGSRPMEVETYFSLVEALRVTPNDLAPSGLMENATSSLGNYARLNGRNQSLIDQFIGVVLKRQNGNDEANEANDAETGTAETTD